MRLAGQPPRQDHLVLFFSLSDWALALVVLAVVAGATGSGVLLGRYPQKHSETLREPFSVLRGRCWAWSRWSWPSA
jgi:hypothetical protein